MAPGIYHRQTTSAVWCLLYILLGEEQGIHNKHTIYITYLECEIAITTAEKTELELGVLQF